MKKKKKGAEEKHGVKGEAAGVSTQKVKNSLEDETQCLLHLHPPEILRSFPLTR